MAQGWPGAAWCPKGAALTTKITAQQGGFPKHPWFILRSQSGSGGSTTAHLCLITCLVPAVLVDQDAQWNPVPEVGGNPRGTK